MSTLMSQVSAARAAGSLARSRWSRAKIGSLIENTKVAVSDGENPCRARNWEIVARLSRTPCHPELLISPVSPLARACLSDWSIARDWSSSSAFCIRSGLAVTAIIWACTQSWRISPSCFWISSAVRLATGMLFPLCRDGDGRQRECTLEVGLRLAHGQELRRGLGKTFPDARHCRSSEQKAPRANTSNIPPAAVSKRRGFRPSAARGIPWLWPYWGLTRPPRVAPLGAAGAVGGDSACCPSGKWCQLTRGQKQRNGRATKRQR